jgi:quercetin dioxygenase-like cupin family protein
MRVKHSNSVPGENVSAGNKTTRQVLISSQEGPNFAMRLFTIAPEGDMPRHTNSVEHEQYVISGCAQIGIADEVYTVSQGDVVFIPANVPHWYKTIGDEPFRFLCMIPNQEDKITLIKT